MKLKIEKLYSEPFEDNCSGFRTNRSKNITPRNNLQAREQRIKDAYWKQSLPTSLSQAIWSPSIKKFIKIPLDLPQQK